MKPKTTATLTHSIPYIAPEEYEKVGLIVETAKAFARSSNQKIYIIDYFKNDFLYVSKSLMRLYKEDEDNIQTFNYETYIGRVPEEERKMLQDIHEKELDLLYTVSVNERLCYTLFYDIHFTYKKKSMLINHKITPLLLTPRGEIWIAVCCMTPSTEQEAGHAMMLHTDKNIFYEYDLQKHEWSEKSGILLKKPEREILSLSAQGCTMEDISSKMNKSIDTIKTCKSNMFKRFHVKSTTEALAYTMNYKLL